MEHRDADSGSAPDGEIAFLLRLSDIFSEDADERATLRKLASIAVPALADWCTVHLRASRP